MAEILVSRKCAVCGKMIEPGEKAQLTAVVKTSRESTHHGPEVPKRKVRVNFFTNSERELRHIGCAMLENSNEVI